MATTKGKKQTIPLIKGNLGINPSALQKLAAFQQEYKAQFDKDIKKAEKEALENYTARLESLKKAKAEMLKSYNAEIKKYKALIKDLKGGGSDIKPKPTARKKKKS